MKFFLKLALPVFTVLNTCYVFADTPGIYCLDNNNGTWYNIAQNPTMNRFVNVGNPISPSGGAAPFDKFYALSPVFLQCRNSMTDRSTYVLRNTLVSRVSRTAGFSPAFINPENNVISYVWKGNAGDSYPPRDREAARVPLPNRNNVATIQLSPSLAIYDGYSNTIPDKTFIGTLTFTLYKDGTAVNNQDLTLRLYTANAPVFQPETCTINNEQPLSVDLGTLDESDISASNGLNSAVTKTLELNYNCANKANSKMKVQLVGEPSSFSSTAVEARTGQTSGTGTRIENLGIEFYHKNIALAPNSINGFLTEITNGVGRDTLTIAPVKSPSANAINLPYGYFNASATLILTIP